MQLFKDIANLFFPELCLCCENVLTNNEKIICTTCNFELPLANFIDNDNNSIKKIFFGRINIENATALFIYSKKGIVKNLIHNLKYYGHQEIGGFLGKWLGSILAKSKNYTQIDYIVPVPLHQKRLKKRGYNQVSKFGEAISICLDIPYLETVLIRVDAANTQSKKKRLDRWKNVEEMFVITDLNLFENKHILLLDDIITTGATIETCYNELVKIKNIKISLAVMAFTN